MTGCNKDFDDIDSEFMASEIEPCFFNNDCLKLNENLIELDIVLHNKINKSVQSFINYLQKPDQYDFINFLFDNYGIPFWNGTYLVQDSEESEVIFSIPLINKDSKYTEFALVVNFDKNTGIYKYNLISRDEIENYKKIDSSITYNSALTLINKLDLLNFIENKNFLSNSDNTLTKIINQHSKQENDKKGGDLICYAVYYEITTKWYQYTYNANGGVWTQLSNTYSYQWSNDLCVAQDIPVPSSSPPSGGSTSSPSSGSGGGVNGQLCVQSLNGRKIGNAYYYGLKNLSIGFYYDGSSSYPPVNYNINFNEICLRTHSQYSLSYNDRQIQRAFKDAAQDAVDYLTELTNSGFPVTSSMVKLSMKTFLAESMRRRFAGSLIKFDLSQCNGVTAKTGIWGSYPGC